MKLRRAIAMATAISAMSGMFAMTVFAEDEWNTNGGRAEIEGIPSIVSPTIEVELPGDLSFGINPLKMNVSEDPEHSNTAAIISGDYYVTNYSNIPVAVRTTTFVSAANDKVELKSSMTSADWSGNELKASSTPGNKAIWLTQLFAKTLTTNTEGVPTMTTTTVAGGTKATTSSTLDGETLVKSTDGSGITQKPIFVLDAFDEANPTKWAASMAGFRFDGAVDPGAAFEDGDITVKSVFELKTLTAEQAASKNIFTDYACSGGSSTKFHNTKKSSTW